MPDRDQQQFVYEQVPTGIRADGTLDGLLQTYSPVHYTTMIKNRNLDDLLQKTKLVGDRPQQLPFVINVNGFQLTDLEKNKLLHLWKTLVLEYPLQWLSHKISVFKHVIGFDGKRLWSAVFMKPNSYDWATKMYGRPYPDLSRVQTLVKHFLSKLEWQTPIYRPWIYLLMSLLVTVAVLQLSEERFGVACIVASGLANEVGLFFLAPAPEYRYSHYMIYTSILSFLLFVLVVVRKIPD
jgi:hypothetical protein